MDPLILDDGTALFDVIVLQSHMYWMPVWPMEKLWNMCEHFKKYDKPIHFTELSIHSGNKVGGVWQVSRETEE